MTNTERLALALIVLGVLSRLVPHPPNMTAVVGVTLLGAYVIRSLPVAALVPLAAMAIGDLLLGWHASALFTYVGMLLGTLIGHVLLTEANVIRIGAAAFLTSLGFFVVSNLGVWLEGFYGYTLEGLVACFVAAIPFWGNSLVGDLGSTAILFGVFFLARRHVSRTASP